MVAMDLRSPGLLLATRAELLCQVLVISMGMDSMILLSVRLPPPLMVQNLEQLIYFLEVVLLGIPERYP